MLESFINSPFLPKILCTATYTPKTKENSTKKCWSYSTKLFFSRSKPSNGIKK